VSVQWFTTKMATAINAAAMTMAIGCVMVSYPVVRSQRHHDIGGSGSGFGRARRCA
jgi:hypothetical protein